MKSRRSYAFTKLNNLIFDTRYTHTGDPLDPEPELTRHAARAARPPNCLMITLSIINRTIIRKRILQLRYHTAWRSIRHMDFHTPFLKGNTSTSRSDCQVLVVNKSNEISNLPCKFFYSQDAALF